MLRIVKKASEKRKELEARKKEQEIQNRKKELKKRGKKTLKLSAIEMKQKIEKDIKEERLLDLLLIGAFVNPSALTDVVYNQMNMA